MTKTTLKIQKCPNVFFPLKNTKNPTKKSKNPLKIFFIFFREKKGNYFMSRDKNNAR